MGLGIFGKRRRAGYTSQDVVDAVIDRGNPAYLPWYYRPGGTAAATQIASGTFDHYATYPQYTLDQIVFAANNNLRVDNTKYLSNLQRLQRFTTRANQRFYAQGLGRRGNREIGLHFVPGQRTSDLDRATDWVIKASNTLKGSGADSKAWKDLRNAIEVVVTTREPVDIATLNYLHTATGHQAFAARTNTDPTLFYGTTAMGMHFLPRVFDAARGFQNQTHMYGDHGGATDLAVLLMLGSILAHAKGDGNGRTARALYACTIMKYNRRFIPAAHDWVQNQLHEVNLTAIAHPDTPDYLRPPNQKLARRQRGGAHRGGLEQVDMTPVVAAPVRDRRGRRIYDIGDPE